MYKQKLETMSVDELNNNELEELLESFKYQLRGEGEETEEVIENLSFDDVKVHYDNYDFVKDDFFCNIEY